MRWGFVPVTAALSGQCRGRQRKFFFAESAVADQVSPPPVEKATAAGQPKTDQPPGILSASSKDD